MIELYDCMNDANQAMRILDILDANPSVEYLQGVLKGYHLLADSLRERARFLDELENGLYYFDR